MTNDSGDPVGNERLTLYPAFERGIEQSEQGMAAGLAAMRYLDAWASGVRPIPAIGKVAFDRAFGLLPAFAPERPILRWLVDALTAEVHFDDARVAQHLLAYQNILMRRSQWPLAADVIHATIRYANCTSNRQLAVQGYGAVGYCWRHFGVDEAAGA